MSVERAELGQAASAARRKSRRQNARGRLKNYGPASSAGTIRIIETPVSVDPCLIAA
jgi:hypothetical protein